MFGQQLVTVLVTTGVFLIRSQTLPPITYNDALNQLPKFRCVSFERARVESEMVRSALVLLSQSSRLDFHDERKNCLRI
jgi:hypothetical protein